MAEPFPDMADLHARGMLEVAGTNRPSRLSFEGPFDGAGGRFYLASLAYRHLSATWPVVNLDPALFLAFFEDLARHPGGWEGDKWVASLDDDFSVRCEYHGHRFRPEVWMHVRLASDSVDPYWSAELRLILWPESLTDLARRAGLFLGTQAEPGAAVL